MILHRRALIGSLLAAPAVVRYGSLMRVAAPVCRHRLPTNAEMRRILFDNWRDHNLLMDHFRAELCSKHTLTTDANA